MGSPLPTDISSSQTDHKDQLSKAVEVFRRQVANKTNSLYTEQGPDSSKAFLSALCTLPTESFDRLWTGVLNSSTPFNPNTDASTDVSNRGKIGTTGDKMQKAYILV
jgi:hypothetical protein